MVARIEVKPVGMDWIFEKNVMPGLSVGISDPLKDGGREVIAIECDNEDETTTVTRLREGEFVMHEDGKVDLLKKPDAVLRLGDPHFLTTIQSDLTNNRIGLRISHQNKY